MSADPNTGRRRLLIGGAATIAGAAAVGVAVWQTSTDEVDTGTTTSTSAEADSSAAPPPASDEEAVANVGVAYLRDHPDEADEATLRGLVPELTAVTASALVAELAALSPRVRAEFESDDVVLVDGWILARSEARGAALVSLA